VTDSMPPWWPRGADEALVRECTCGWCEALIERLEDAREGIAVDGEHRSLAAYSGGEADD
jgi:hypothetical protein